ncbi:MAG: hypothetical protein QOI71_2620, partial [Gaiellales bacterium]|nr:hypothetical protein [Gaiellales bacterium]
GLPPLPLDPAASFELAPALAERLAALAGELGAPALPDYSGFGS